MLMTQLGVDPTEGTWEDFEDVIPVTEDTCLDVIKWAEESGEDREDLIVGCVLGAIKVDNFERAKAILAQGTAEERRRVLVIISENFGNVVANKIVPAAPAAPAEPVPWYKNWRYLVPIGIGTAAAAGLAVCLYRRPRGKGRSTSGFVREPYRPY